MIQLKDATYRVKDYDKDGTVVIMVNSFNIEDDQGDISLKGSFSKTIRDGFNRWRYLFNHDGTRKIGEPLEAWEANEGLIVKAVLNLNKDDGRNTYEDYKLAAEYGRGVEHSVAVRAIQSKGSAPRYVAEWMLKEFSYIPVWGSNPNTPLLAIKAEDKQFVEYCMKNGNHTDCYIKKYESLLEPSDTKTLDAADDDQIIKFYNSLNFIDNGRQ